jgi:hypothetical protein
MKNIHVLATNKPSRLYIGDNQNFVFGMIQTSIQSRNDCFTNQHIYITSDEEIEWDSYWLNRDNNVVSNGAMFELADKAPSCKKIILTTDQSLDGVQAIDDEFLEWFIKNPSCEEVNVENEEYIVQYLFKPQEYKFRYKIIIPIEEQTKCYCGHTSYCDCGPEKPKKETLEEAISRTKEEYTFLFNEEFFELCAKWQQKKDIKELKPNPLLMDEVAHWDFRRQRSYSEEEVIELLQKALTHQDDGETGSLVTAQGKIRPANFFNWFEQFKK